MAMRSPSLLICSQPKIVWWAQCCKILYQSNLQMFSGVLLTTNIKLERSDRDKHSNLIRTLINSTRKKFYNIEAWAKCYKTFYGRNLRMLTAARVLVPGRLFSLIKCLWVRLTFEWNNWKRLQSGSLLPYSQTRWERPAKDKLSGIFRKFVNYGCKKFINIWPWSHGYTVLIFLTLTDKVCHCKSSLLKIVWQAGKVSIGYLLYG
jgi:hypothetical protein